ncbi:MAG: hypothetical protein WCH43_15550 [Verrucomicrobiota bacterium]
MTQYTVQKYIVPNQLTSVRSIFKRAALFALFLLGVNSFTLQASAPTHFDFKTDVFAFSNDTVFAYGTDEAGNLTMRKRETPVEFSHRCFVLARAAMQFHQFARFVPDAPRIAPEEYRRLAKKICRIPVWRTLVPPESPVIIPGYRNLREFSKAHEHMLKEELGNWFPSYIRVGNWRMSMIFPRFGQKWAAGNLTRALDDGKLQAVYLARSLHMNHCVVLFDYHREKNGDLIFDLYDPNYPGEKGKLTYHAAERSFDFPKRWFWTGGRINLMRVYITPFH